jgi:L-alanine-DL-glutamate epimerase-like enolase superfamily enzyme
VPPTPDAAALVAALAALPLVVDGAACTITAAALPSYPGGKRPGACVTLAGAGARGTGEHVAWTDADHAGLAAALAGLVPRGRWTLGAWAAEMARRTPAPYARAALEAAAVDLALRQHDTTLFALAGAAPRPVRYVASFGRSADAAALVRRLRTAAPGLEWKIDVDPGWDEAVYAALAAAGQVAVLDFKGDGTGADHARAHRFLPAALLEDPSADAAPWSPGVRSRLSLDAVVQRAADVGAFPVTPAAVNVKPARLGGVFEALRTIAACQAAGIAVYLGGMWEVDVGRRQLHVLAALFAPGGPNDVAPLAAGAPRPPRLVVDAGRAGFG